MPFKIAKLFFLFVIVFSIPIQAQNNIQFTELDSISTAKPNLAIELLESYESLTDLQRNYIFIKSSENLGHYKNVDSAIVFTLNNVEFPSDSNLYFEILKIYSDEKKISDDFTTALKILYDLFEFSERRKDTLKLISIHASLGELYRATESFDLGLTYLKKGEELSKAYGKTPKRLIARIFNRRAAIFLQGKTNLDSVEVLSQKVIQIAKQLGDKDMEANSSNELGYLYMNLGNPKAEFYLNNAISNWDEIGYSIYATNARLNLSRFYNLNGKFEDAIFLLLKTLEQVENSEWQWERGSYYEVLSVSYAGNKEFELAFKYSNLAREILLDVSEKQYNEKLALLATELEVEKKEKEIISKQKEIDLAKIENAQSKEERKYLFWFLIIAISIVLVLLLLSILANNQRLKLREQQAININTNNKLKELVSQKETLLKEVNHRVKNNLSVLAGLLYLQQKELKNEEAINILKESQIRINTIALIHESLYQRDDMESIDFQDYLGRLIGYIKSIYWEKETEIDLELNCQDLKPDLSNSIPMAMILNELITNSFKYAFSGSVRPKIGIEFNKSENELIYFDNGPGFSKTSTKGSLGLKLVDIFCTQLKAKIESNNIDNYYVTYIKFT